MFKGLLAEGNMAPVTQAIALEEMYFKTCNSSTCNFSISVWGSCSPATFAEIEGSHLKAARVIYRLPRHVKDSGGLQRVYWQNIRHIYKRELAIEMFKAKHNLSSLSPHLKIVESRREGKLMEVSKKNLELGRDSFLFRGPVVWNCLNKTV